MYKNLAAALRAAFFVSIASGFSPAAQAQAPSAPGPVLKVGFVHVTPVTEAGWVHQHDLGRKQLEAALGDRVKTTTVENVAE